MKTNRNDPNYSFQHTKQRMKERYNLDINEVEYKELCLNCIKGEKTHNESTPKGDQEIYKVMFKNIEIITVYQTWKKQVSTVLYNGY